MSKMFLPLRSNAGWFTNAETRYALEARIKRYMLLYDELLLQDGRYTCSISETGSFDSLVPHQALKNIDRSEIAYYTPGQDVQVQVAANPDGEWHPVFRGPLLSGYEADFYPILLEAGILGADYIEWLDGDLAPSAKSAAQQQAGRDAQIEQLQQVLPPARFHRKAILQGLYIDSLLSRALALPFSVDPHAGPVIEWNAQQVLARWERSVPPVLYIFWIKLGFPDYADASWDEVHEVRESGAGRDFRRMVERVSAAVMEALPDIERQEDVDLLVQKEFTHELAAEIDARRSGYGIAMLNLALNFIPLGYLPGTFNDFRSALSEQQSWVSLLKRQPERGT